MEVHEVMSPNVISIAPDESVSLASRLIARYNIGALPVCSDSGILRGVVTDRDIVLRCIAAEENPAETPVRNIMSQNLCSIAPSDDIRAATHRMASHRVRRLPMVSNGKVVGMLSLGDLAGCHQCNMEASKALADISENIFHPTPSIF